jgi:DNA-binding MarR family transcriptional regulator
MGIAKTNASPMVEALVRAGLLNRLPDLNDRRQAQFFLSDIGQKEYEDGMVRLSAAFEALLTNVPDSEGPELVAAITRVLGVLRQLAIPNRQS